MVEHTSGGERDKPKGLLMTQPASELFQHVPDVIRLWPQEATQNPSFLQYIDAHTDHIRAFQEIDSSLPNPTLDLETALNEGLISSEHLQSLYLNLSEMLVDKDTERLVLYVPFEFLPSSSWAPTDPSLSTAVDTFKSSYLQAWQKQLLVHDVRANFADGDVLESSQRTADLPRVVKAAHLIPELLSRGIITSDTVQTIFESTDDALLKKSIADALNIPLKNEYSQDSLNPNIIEPRVTPTQRRQEWLDQKSTEESVLAYGKQLSQYILDTLRITGDVPPISFEKTSEIGQQILAEGIQVSIEQASRNRSVDAMTLFESFKADIINEIQLQDNNPVKERLSQLLRRVHKLGLMDEAELTELGIAIPALSGDLRENLARIPELTAQLKELTKLIEEDPELSALIYPFISVGGSRLKGYGTQSSDIDISIFVRPETNLDQKDTMRTLLQKHLDTTNILDDPTEFWLETKDDILHIKDVEDTQEITADHYWTHTLINNPFIGQAREITSVQKRLLPPYFESPITQKVGRSERALYLERIEQDLLQYRLMHKGYARHYPRVSEPRNKAIDGDSMFWDSGYRRLATKLFIEKVFLPKTI